MNDIIKLIQIMNISNKDLNLLIAFLVIAEELNLSKASTRLKLSQPGLSHVLKKMRDEWSDPLFVRASRGLVPTPKASSLVPKIREALKQLEDLYQSPDSDPFTSLSKRFVLGATTYFELRVISNLLKDFAEKVPGATLETRSLQGEFPKEELERGEMDLAVAAYFQNIPESFRMKVLGKDPHVCICRKSNPYLKTRRKLQDFLHAKHMRIAVPPNRESLIDIALKERGKARQITAHLSNFLTPPWVLASSDLLLTCPKTLALSYQKSFSLAITELPLEVPPVEIKMVWHERNHSDVFQKWVRERIAHALSLNE